METAGTGSERRPAPSDAGAPASAAEPAGDDRRGAPRWPLVLAALGVVYGDIGTSPLYALRECFHGAHAVPPTRANVLGALSLVFWAFVVVMSVKYLVVVLRADNRGEGGILALTALVRPAVRREGRAGALVVALGLFGAALLYGDGMITPAISVLSAVEGLHVATTRFDRFVRPLAIAILVLFFLFQRRGTGVVGRAFGPVTVVWFLTLAALGLPYVVRSPEVLGALSPVHAARFLGQEHGRGFLALGAVFLVVTGGEALYADLGHFGPRPIRRAWFALVLPALLLNYFGQGALLLVRPAAASNPFYRLAPAWMLYPLVALATAATIVASQAVVSGCFSLTSQAVRLGFAPRVPITHTSPEEKGQVYVPLVNWVLLASTVALVLGFGSSAGLAAAYGVAVSATMVITTVLVVIVARRRWRWPLAAALGTGAFFLGIDLAFLGANTLKIPAGGWFPLIVGGAGFTLMSTWNRGRRLLAARMTATAVPTEAFLRDLAAHPVVRVPGTAVFLTSDPYGTPPALLHNLKHNHVVHERVVVLSVTSEEVPHVPRDERLALEDLGHGFHRLIVRAGFRETPDVPQALRAAGRLGLEVDLGSTTYFLGRERVLATDRPGMAKWRERLFALMVRNAQGATHYFRIPPSRVVELGAQVEM